MTAGIVMALSGGQGVSRAEVLELLKAVTALVEVEAERPQLDQPAPSGPEAGGPAPVFVPDPKWGR
jgi:hypothetical protein